MGRAFRQLRDTQDFVFESGRSKEGTFLRVVHLPTGKCRLVDPVGRLLRESRCTYTQLLSALDAGVNGGSRTPPNERVAS